MLDLYMPQGGAAKPALGAAKPALIVWIHGGAWKSGSKINPPAAVMLRQGYAVASIDYRLTDVAQFPAQIEDCKAAIRWLRANAAKYGYIADRIAVWGSSAGGHLVALLGTSGGVKELEGSLGNEKFSSRVQAVVDYFGPTDFIEMTKFPSSMNHAAANSPEAALIGGPVLQNPEKVARVNPITYITRDDPPFLIVHGDKDPLVPLNQSELLLAALKKAGVPATLRVIEGGGHGGPGFQSPETLALVSEFLAKHIRD